MSEATNNESEQVVTDYNIQPKELRLTIGGAKYVMLEASGDVACRYRNALLDCTELGPEGTPVRVKNMADLEPYLVSMCLYPVNADGTVASKSVSPVLVRSWPSRVQKALYVQARKLGDIADTPAAISAADAAAKKEQAGTPIG